MAESPSIVIPKAEKNISDVYNLLFKQHEEDKNINKKYYDRFTKLSEMVSGIKKEGMSKKYAMGEKKNVQSVFEQAQRMYKQNKYNTVELNKEDRKALLANYREARMLNLKYKAAASDSIVAKTQLKLYQFYDRVFIKGKWFESVKGLWGKISSKLGGSFFFDLLKSVAFLSIIDPNGKIMKSVMAFLLNGAKTFVGALIKYIPIFIDFIQKTLKEVVTGFFPAISKWFGNWADQLKETSPILSKIVGWIGKAFSKDGVFYKMANFFIENLPIILGAFVAFKIATMTGITKLFGFIGKGLWALILQAKQFAGVAKGAMLNANLRKTTYGMDPDIKGKRPFLSMEKGGVGSSTLPKAKVVPTTKLGKVKSFMGNLGEKTLALGGTGISKVGKFGTKVLGGVKGGVGGLAAMAVEMVVDEFLEDGTLKTITKGAATGAGIGSFFGPWGAALGAAIGTGVGGLQAINQVGKEKGQVLVKKMETKTIQQEEARKKITSGKASMGEFLLYQEEIEAGKKRAENLERSLYGIKRMTGKEDPETKALFEAQKKQNELLQKEMVGSAAQEKYREAYFMDPKQKQAELERAKQQKEEERIRFERQYALALEQKQLSKEANNQLLNLNATQLLQLGQTAAAGLKSFKSMINYTGKKRPDVTGQQV